MARRGVLREDCSESGRQLGFSGKPRRLLDFLQLLLRKVLPNPLSLGSRFAPGPHNVNRKLPIDNRPFQLHWTSPYRVKNHTRLRVARRYPHPKKYLYILGVILIPRALSYDSYYAGNGPRIILSGIVTLKRWSQLMHATLSPPSPPNPARAAMWIFCMALHRGHCRVTTT
jgi:hypothetical protein